MSSLCSLKAMARDLFEASEDACVRMGRPFIAGRPLPLMIEAGELSYEHAIFTMLRNRDPWLEERRDYWNDAALEATRKYHEVSLQAKVLSNIGTRKLLEGDAKEAQLFQEDAIRTAEQSHDRLTIGRASCGLSTACRYLGEYRTATKHAEFAVQIAIELEDHVGKARAFAELASVHFAQEEDELVVACLQASLQAAREVSDEDSICRACANLANVAIRNGTDAKAVVVMQELALDAAKLAGDRVAEGRVFGNLGLAYEGLGGYKRTSASFMYEQALSISEEQGDVLGRGRASLLLGRLCMNNDQLVRGAELLQQGMDIATHYGDLPGRIWASSLIATILHKVGLLKRSVEEFGEARKLALRIGDFMTEACAAYEMATIFLEMASETMPLSISVMDEKEMFEKAYLRKWMEYTRPEFLEAVDEMRVQADNTEAEDQIVALAKCLDWVKEHTPGATRLDADF